MLQKPHAFFLSLMEEKNTKSARQLITISPGVQLNQETTPVMAKMGKLQLCKRR
jgi:hypothetical protein